MQNALSLPRRRFLKTFAWTAAVSTLRGKSWEDWFTAEVQAATDPALGSLQIKLSDFPALQEEFGSVRFIINPLTGRPPDGPRPNGQFYPIIINRGTGNAFYALNSKCTHELCVVPPLDEELHEMVCVCHGSRFAIDGARIAGLALAPMARYTITFDGQNTLTIQIPGLGFAIRGTSVPAAAGGNPRLRLDFSALKNVTYEVQFRDTLGKAPAAVPFALSASGSLNQTAYTPTANASASLFVERLKTTGFFLVTVRLAEG
jgi:Rieske Fe-S protein